MRLMGPSNLIAFSGIPRSGGPAGVRTIERPPAFELRLIHASSRLGIPTGPRQSSGSLRKLLPS